MKYKSVVPHIFTKPLNTPKIRQLELFVKTPTEPWNWPKFPEKVAELIKNGSRR